MADPAECRYAKTHEWIAVSGDEGVVGVSDHAQKEITDVVFVELPEAGRLVKQGEAIGVIESVKAAFDFYAPVSGEVVAVNDAVTGDPAVVNRSAQDEGWLVKIKLSDPGELDALMAHDAYLEFAKTPAH